MFTVGCLHEAITNGTADANVFQDAVLDGRVEFSLRTDDSVSDGGGKCWTTAFLASCVFLQLKGIIVPSILHSFTMFVRSGCSDLQDSSGFLEDVFC